MMIPTGVREMRYLRQFLSKAALVLVLIAADGSLAVADLVAQACVQSTIECQSLKSLLWVIKINADRVTTTTRIRDKDARGLERLAAQALTSSSVADANQQAIAYAQALKTMRTVADPEDSERINRCVESCREDIAWATNDAAKALRRAGFGGMAEIQPWLEFFGRPGGSGSDKGNPNARRDSPCALAGELHFTFDSSPDVVKLHLGRGTTASRSGAVSYFIKRCVAGDLDRDGNLDAAAVLCRTENSESTHFVISMTLDTGGKFKAIKVLTLPGYPVVGVEGIDITTKRDISVRLRKLGPDDARCCPSMIETRAYSLSDKGELTQRFVSLTRAPTTDLRSPSSDASDLAVPPVRQEGDIKLEDLFAPGEREKILESEKERQGSRGRP